MPLDGLGDPGAGGAVAVGVDSPGHGLVHALILQKLGKFTKSEIMELVPAIGKASVENSLKQLVKDGEIQRHGKGKSTFYTRSA